jgi:hypothetical protein
MNDTQVSDYVFPTSNLAQKINFVNIKGRPWWGGPLRVTLRLVDDRFELDVVHDDEEVLRLLRIMLVRDLELDGFAGYLRAVLLLDDAVFDEACGSDLTTSQEPGPRSLEKVLLIVLSFKDSGPVDSHHTRCGEGDFACRIS